MTALIIIGAVFLAVYVAMLIVTKHAMPYDPAWDDWEEEQKK